MAGGFHGPDSEGVTSEVHGRLADAHGMEQRDPVEPVAGFPLMDMAAQRIRIVAADGIEQAREAGDVVFHLLFAGVLQAQEFGLDFADVPGLFGELQAEQPHIAFEDADEGAEAFSLSHVECGVGLKPYSTWKFGKTKADLIEEMAAKLETMPGYSVGFSQPIIDMVMDQIAGAHSDLALKIYSDDITESRHIADQVANVLKEIPGAADVAVDQEPPLPQLQIIADRARIAQYGLNVSDVADLIELAIGGASISQIFVGSKSYDVICRFDDASRNSPERIGNLLLTTGSGTKIPLSQVAEIKMTTGASTITREMNKRHLTVRVNLRGVDLTAFLNKANALIDKEVKYDHDSVHLKWAGQFENQHRAYARLGAVVPLALGLMLLLLFAACGKFRQAALMMSVVPLALFGGMLALNVRGMTLNVSSAVGFIALVGVAIQNGVIMISHINNLRTRERDLKDAVITGTKHRFRPILMTATVAVLGLLPASVSTGIGSDVQRPLATVIVYGLLFATVITLYVLPALYYMIEKHYEGKDLTPVSEEKELHA